MAEHGDRGDDRPVVRLSCLLRAYPGCNDGSGHSYDDIYWQSPEVATFLIKADGLGLTMSLINTGVLLLMPLLRPSGTARRSLEPNAQTALACLLLLSVLQLLLLRKRVGVYLRYRHYISLGNRVLRAAVALLPALNRNGDVLGNWGSPEQYSAAAALALYAVFPSFLPLQASCAYPLPIRAGIIMQPLATAVALCWLWHSPASMHKLPGMHAVATSVCSIFRSVFELMLCLVTDMGFMPGVAAAGLAAFGLPDRCKTGMVYAQLLVFATLLLSFMVPLYTAYVSELHHKLSFWQARGMAVKADRSLLLPLPETPLASHVVVGVVAPTVLWFVAESLAPYMQLVSLAQ
ncbi:hypothetical protein COO60DRAFT_224776 [Scenedesmus sp. NREL 46B-D3]|nr:hypothetical protein COO60DRAFT_224776 [Scenedesmus sp. NREL 46B-D3]